MRGKSLLSKWSRVVLAAAAFLAINSSASAQVSISSLSSYQQNFNSLTSSGTSTWTDNTTLAGWYVDNGPTTTLKASTGSDNTAGLKSYGSNNANDRALGCVTSNATGNFYYGLRMKNNTGNVIRDFVISYRTEQWTTVDNRKTRMRFNYKKGATMNSLAGNGWVLVDELEISTSVGNNDAVVNGNSNGNFYTVTATISDIELAAGEEIMFRWNDGDNNAIYLGLDDITVTPSNSQRFFYSKSSGSLHSKANWGSSTNGNGTQPESFTSSYQTFIIQNNVAPTITNSWTVSGDHSKVVVGNGYAAINFTIPSQANDKFTGVIDVTDHATLTINNATLPTIGTLGNLSTVIYNNAAVQDLPSADYGNLTINASTKRLQVNTRVKKSLTLSGANMELGAYDLTLDAGATISGVSAANYIITNGAGKLKMPVANTNTDVLFPVGSANAYLPVKIKQTAGATTDVFSVKALDGVYDNYTNNSPDGVQFGNKAVNKTWIVDETITGGSDVTLTFMWDNANALTGFDPTQARITHFYNGGWDDDTPVNAALVNGFYQVSRSNITSFSPFGVFSGSPSPLPVELVSFEARRTENGIVCSWKTAQELNNDYFTVERSADGREFSAVGTVKGAGSTSQARQYQFTDVNAPQERTYYRLRQTDFDGTTTYSEIVVTENRSLSNVFTLEVYPNPGNGLRYLRSRGNLTETTFITLTDAQGKTVLETTLKPEQLQAGQPIDLTGLPQGLYFLKAQTGRQITNSRVLQQ